MKSERVAALAGRNAGPAGAKTLSGAQPAYPQTYSGGRGFELSSVGRDTRRARASVSDGSSAACPAQAWAPGKGAKRRAAAHTPVGSKCRVARSQQSGRNQLSESASHGADADGTCPRTTTTNIVVAYRLYDSIPFTSFHIFLYSLSCQRLAACVAGGRWRGVHSYWRAGDGTASHNHEPGHNPQAPHPA